MRHNRKLGFLAVLLPLAGLVLIMPPLVLIASNASTIFGIPSIVLYLFAVWFGLIGSAFLLQRHLSDKHAAPLAGTQVAEKTEGPQPGNSV